MRGGASRSFGVEVASLAGVPEEVTSRAKRILKKLEKNDLARGAQNAVEPEEPESPEAESSPVLDELAALDINTLTPMAAFQLIVRWKENK